jgi:hypothetical protein
MCQNSLQPLNYVVSLIEIVFVSLLEDKYVHGGKVRHI